MPDDLGLSIPIDTFPVNCRHRTVNFVNDKLWFPLNGKQDDFMILIRYPVGGDVLTGCVPHDLNEAARRCGCTRGDY